MGKRILMIFLDFSCITITAQHELIALVEFGHLCLCTGTVVAYCIDKTLVLAADFSKAGILRGTGLIALRKESSLANQQISSCGHLATIGLIRKQLALTGEKREVQGGRVC